MKTRRRMKRRPGYGPKKAVKPAVLVTEPEPLPLVELPVEPEPIPALPPEPTPEPPPPDPIPEPQPEPIPEPPPPPLTHKITIPQVVYDVLVQQKLPLDTCYHPLYNLIGVSPQTSEQALECIAFGKDWPSEMGGLGAFGHLKRFIDQTWPGLEWNDWLEKMLRSLCDSDYETKIGQTRVRYVNWVGAGACVAGHTRLYDPVSGKSPTIKNLCDTQTEPWVLTVAGPVKARTPFKRGTAALYEVTLDSGECFQATADHLVMRDDGSFLPVESLKIGVSLAGYAFSQLESRQEFSPSVHVGGGRSSCQKVPDSRDGCQIYSYSDDGLPQTVGGGVGLSGTLRNDVLRHSRFSVRSDGLGGGPGYSHPYRLCAPQANSDSFPPCWTSNLDRSSLPVLGTELPCGERPQGVEPSHLLPIAQLPNLKEAPGFGGRFHFSPQSHWLTSEDWILSLVASPDSRVQARVVQSIKYVGEADFYDLQVPVWNHYFAEGIFHHNCGKTFCAGLFACAWFIYDMACNQGPKSSVTLTSTSKGIIAQRVWPVIQKLYREAKFTDSEQQLKWGHMIDSMKQVQFRKGDAKHSICAMAVEPGELQGALDKIKGRHTERMLLIVDEANSTPQAIFECIPNMLTAARELIVLVIGNAGSRLDPHGRCCEPRAGWKSITIDAEQWETRGVPQWGIGPGVCLHFDGQKSPNVLAGKTVHKHIYSFERWQQVLRMGDEYRNTLQHWSQDRGFWPPDGISTTIFSEAMVISHDGMGKFDWLSPPETFAALDPAFGGDDCWLQFGLVGDVRGPKKAIQLLEGTLVPFDPDSPDAVDFQIAKYVKEVCLKKGVLPHHFGTDATGTGRGVASHLNQIWSPRIHAVEFAGRASELPASVEDPRESKEVYANRWSELWYICREFLCAGQLRGLSSEAVKQFCSRNYKYESRKYKIESKEDMKIRMGYSPDQADSIAVLVDVARMNGTEVQQMTTTASGRQKPRGDWEEVEDDVASLAAGGYSETQTFDQYAA